MKIPVRLAFVAAAAWALSGAPDAGATWTEPIEVSAAGLSATAPQVGVDAAGNVTAVWVSDAPGAIRSAYRPSGGPWEESFTRVPASLDCSDPQLAVNPAGAAVVVADCGTGAETMHVARRAAGGSWAGALELPGSGSGEDPRVGLDPAGNAIVVWQSGATVQSAYRAAAGSWVGATQVSPAGDVALDPQVAMGPTGAALVAWRRDGADPVVSVESSIRRSAGSWTPPSPRSPPPTAAGPVVAYEPQVRWSAGDDRLILWENHPVGGSAILQKTAGAGGEFGGWGNGIALWQSAAGGSTSIEVPQFAVDDAGRAVAVWRSFDGASFRTMASTTSSIFGSWSTPLPLAGEETGLAEPQVAADPAGAAAAVWRTAAGTISAATRPAGGAFRPAATISGDGTTGLHPRVAMTAGGDAIAAWPASSAGSWRIAVAIDDVTPPVLTAVTVPSGVQAGTAASMSAAAADAWSPVTLAWDLGDGTTIAGDTISHAYAAAGTRSVTVTATDAAGNTATETREIVVAPVPGAPNPGGGDPGGGGDAVITAVTLGVSVPKQSWRTIRKRKAVRLRCTLDVAGTCGTQATITRRLAKRLRLRIGPRAATRRVGRGSVAIAPGPQATKLEIPLGRKVRRAIGRARRRLALTFVVTGNAPGRAPATLTRPLKIRRR